MEGGDSDNDGGGSSVKLVAAHSIEDARFVADSTLAYEHGYFVHDPQGDSDPIFFEVVYAGPNHRHLWEK